VSTGKPESAYHGNKWKYLDDTLKERLRKNTVTNIAFFVLTFPIMFVLTPFILKHVGKELYGAWSLVTTILIFVELAGGLMTTGSASIIIPKYNPREKEKDINEVINTTFFFYIASSLVIGVLFYIFRQKVMDTFFRVSPGIRDDVWFVLAFSLYAFLLNFILTAFVNLLSALNVLYITYIMHTIAAYLRAAAMVAALLLGYGIKGIAVVQMASILIETAVLMIFVKKVYPLFSVGIRYINPGKFRLLISTGFKLVVSRISSLFGQNADKLILGYFINPVFAGYYQIGSSISKYIMQIPDMLGLSTLMSAASELKSRDMGEKIHTLFVRTTRYVFFAGILMGAGILVFGREFTLLWLGAGFEDVQKVMIVLAFAYTVSLLGYPAMNILNGMERVKEVMWASVAVSILNFILSVVLTKYYGLNGTLVSAAISLTAGGLTFYIIYRIVTKKAGGIVLSLLKPAVSASAAFGVIFLMEYFFNLKISWIMFMFKASVFTIVYLIFSVAILKTFDEYDMNLIKTTFRIKAKPKAV
jgi:O-antigen/teichoic acid export membrane protein